MRRRPSPRSLGSSRMMPVNGLLVLAGVFCMAFLSAIVLRDPVYCSVSGSGSPRANGYYAALNGVYIKAGPASSPALPTLDAYQLYAAHRDASSTAAIFLRSEQWTIEARGARNTRATLYTNRPSDARSLYQPPADGWQTSTNTATSTSSSDPSSDSAAASPAPTLRCHGLLSDSPVSAAPSQADNLAALLAAPVTAALLAAIVGFAYHLWTRRVDPVEVATSYDLVVTHQQYWRMVSASFAHFEPFHLLFNAMTLYQLGFLEGVYGSARYAYLSFALVLVTMGLCLLFDWVAIHHMQRPEAAFGLGVGYSCVLFAWMVAGSVRQNKFCPIFLFPEFCFPTYVLPFVGLPVNLGPVVLLLVTKVVIPNSSFLGHLSGILIGYPLAWNWLDWLTPPVFLSLSTLVFLALKGWFVLSRLAGFEPATAGQWGGSGSSSPPLESYLAQEVLATPARLRTCSVLLWLAVPPAWWLYGLAGAAPRAVLAWILGAASVARRCLLSGAGPAAEGSAFTGLGLGLCAVLCLGDCATLGAGFFAWPLLVALSRGVGMGGEGGVGAAGGAGGAGGEDGSVGAAAGLALTLALLLVQAAALLALMRLAADLPPDSFASRVCARLGLGASELTAAFPPGGAGSGGAGAGAGAGGGGGICGRLASMWGAQLSQLRQYSQFSQHGQHGQYSAVPTDAADGAGGAFVGAGHRLGSGTGVGVGVAVGRDGGKGVGVGGGAGRGSGGRGGGSVGLAPASQGRKDGPTAAV